MSLRAGHSDNSRLKRAESTPEGIVTADSEGFDVITGALLGAFAIGADVGAAATGRSDDCGVGKRVGTGVSKGDGSGVGTRVGSGTGDAIGNEAAVGALLDASLERSGSSSCP